MPSRAQAVDGDGDEPAVRLGRGFEEFVLHHTAKTALHASARWITYVVVQEPDGWRIVSAQTTPIMV